MSNSLSIAKMPSSQISSGSDDIIGTNIRVRYKLGAPVSSAAQTGTSMQVKTKGVQ